MSETINNRTLSQNIGLIMGPVLFFILYIFEISPENPIASKMAALAALMAVWWMTEAISLGATSLVPLIMMPLMGILDSKTVAGTYISNTIFLFLGGFMIALAMERWELHKRISLLIIKTIGGGPSRIILGFMTACWLLSMFITNTATTIMMLPIGMAVITKMESNYSEKGVRNFAIALMLGIAYSSTIGGIATFVGTVPNLVFREIFYITFPKAPVITFAEWMLFGVPLSLVMLVIIWFLLTKMLFRSDNNIKTDKSIIQREYKQLGKMNYEERMVLIIFFAASLMWIFRQDIDLGMLTVYGWSHLIPYSEYIDDSTVAIFLSIVLFIMPAGKSSNSKTLLGADVFKKVPWEIIVLFGGGFALAKGFQISGLSEIIGDLFIDLENIPVILLIAAVCLGITFLTELTSNTATTQTLLPILAAIAVAMEINPLLLMIPAAISASFAFMLPVATPPNAIVFSSDRIKISNMVKAGIFINFIGAFVITILFYYFGTEIFGIDLSVFPDWARI